MNTATTNFENMMCQFAASNHFVWNSNSEAYRAAEMKFSMYSESYRSVMPYSFFIANILN